MKLKILKSKLHNAIVTEASLNYVGSITIDKDLMDAAGIKPYEAVLIANKANGERLETYVLEGERGSKTICPNGAAAHLIKKGHEIIIMSFAYFEEDLVDTFQPKIVILNNKNEVIQHI